MKSIDNPSDMRVATHQDATRSQEARLACITQPWQRRPMGRFVLMKYRPASGPGLTLERQPSKKRESEAESEEEKSTETLKQPQLIACTTQCSETADENMSVWGGGGLVGWGEKDGEGEKPDETSQKCSSSLPLIGTLPQPDSFIFKAIVCQCANVHYQPLPAWVSTPLS